jgi:hypothetical protein
MKSKPVLVNYIVGLGGRVMTLPDMKRLIKDAIIDAQGERVDRPVRWVGVRGLE